MRFLSLGLVSLAGSVVSSPTPDRPFAREAGIDVSAVASKRLVVYSQDQFQGPSNEIDATNRCVQLESPEYKNLHSYGVVGQVCYFMDTDRCNGNVLITANAQGTEVWGRVDVGQVTGLAGRITSVYCAHQVPSDSLGASAVSVKREENKILDVLFGPGETIVCENTLDNGRCETLSANSACVPIPAGLAYNFHTIYQAGGSICKYYGSACDTTTPVLSLNSKTQNTFLQIPRDVATRIGYVKCQDTWYNTDTSGGSDRKVSEGRTIVANHETTSHTNDNVFPENYSTRSLAVIEGRSSSSTPCDVPNVPDTTEPGFMYFCATTSHDPSLRNCVNYRTCMSLHAMGRCVTLAGERNLYPLFDSLWQAKGAVCKYYKSSCKDEWPVLIIDSRQEKQLPSIDYKKIPFITAITEANCYHDPTSATDLGAGPNTIVLNSTSSFEAYARMTRGLAVVEPRSTAATPCDKPDFSSKVGPGFLYFCATFSSKDPSTLRPEDCVQYRSCLGLKALGQCVSLEKNSNLFPSLDSLWQSQGAICKYYRSSCFDKWPVLIIDSRNLDLPAIDYKKLPFNPVITEARCYLDPTAVELGAGPDTIVVDSISSLHARYAEDRPSKDDPPSLAGHVPQLQDDPVIATSLQPAVNYPTNMQVCHEVNLGGKCFYYAGPGCAPNPFNVDAIESIFLPRGWRCALYPYWNCQADRGPPHYVEARDGDVTINDVGYEVWSATCTPLPF